MSQEFNTPAKPSVKVRGWVDPFHPQATAFGCVMAGTTVADAISKACKLARTRKRYQRRGLVYLGRKTAQGDYKWVRIPQSQWNKVRLKPNDSLTFRLLPEGGGGGKNPLRAILNIVVMAVAVVAAVFTAGTSLFAAGGMLAGATLTAGGLTVGGLIAGSLVGGLVMTMGQMLVDKIAPIKQQSLSTTAADQEDVYSLSGSSNTIDKWGQVPILFGKGCFAPKKAAAPYTELNGDDMYLHELFIWGECGSGDIEISNIKFGDTSITEYDDVEVETWRFDPNNPYHSKLFPTGVRQEDLSVLLKNKDEDTGSTENWVQRTTGDKTSSISIDINFSSLVQFDDSGNAKDCSVTFRIQYRVKGTTTWLDSCIVTKNEYGYVLSTTLDYTITAKSTSPVRRTFYLTDSNGNTVGDSVSSYDVRVRRVTADHDSEEKDDTKIQDESYWTALRTHTSDKPVNISYPVVMTAIRVRATDQLNGSISNMTGDYQVIMKNYNQTTKQWEMSATRDLIPAIRYVLQECSARPQPDSVIDFDNFIETDAYWKSLGWKYDKVLDSQTSVLNMVQDICAAGLASPTFIDGKWAVIVDKPRDEVVMGITSANSWGWAVDRVTSELPHIIQCDFINQATWESDMMEVEVDSSYKDEGRTPIYEKVAFDGVTIPDNIYKQARFHYTDAKTQVRTISMTMWDESLVATRGDLVSLSQPYLIPAGLEAGRIKSVTTNEQGYVTKVTTDVLNSISTISGLGIKIYMNDGKVAHARLAMNQTGNDQTKTLIFTEPITANIERGNKYTLGHYGEEDFLAIITSMKFNADLTCQLTCIDYVEDKYKVFDPNFPIPSFKSLITKPVSASVALTTAPIITDVVTDERALVKVGTTMRARAMFRFGVPYNIDSRASELRGQYRIHNTLDGATGEVVPGKWVTFMNVPVSETIGYCNDVEEGQSYDFRFQYVSVDGKVSKWKSSYGGKELVNITVTGKTNPPPIITELVSEIDPDRGIKLSWSAVNVMDFDHYSVIGAGIGGSIGNSIPDAEDEKAALKTIDNSLWIMPYGASGVLEYGVYAVDIMGNMSTKMATIIVDAVPPKTPKPEFIVTQEGGIIRWQDCKSLWEISHYKVEDVFHNEFHETIDRYLAMTPRKAGYDYDFNITAFDIYGNKSDVGSVGFTVQNPSLSGVMGLQVIGSDLVITWPVATSVFPIKYYNIYEDATLLACVDATQYSMVAPTAPAGSSTNAHSYRVIAVDIAGNESAALEGSITIYPPEAPSVTVTKDGSQTIIRWTAPVSDVVVTDYVVEHEWVVKGDTVVNKELIKEYKALQAYIPALIAGDHTFKVTAVNASGTKGKTGTGYFTSITPPTVQIDECSPVDNNVMVRYSINPDAIFWPIKEYRIFDVDYLSDKTQVTAELGRSDTQFFADIKMQGGEYIYGVITVDVAGNESEMVTRAVTVNQPPNFVLYTDKDSTFNGIKTNMLLDGAGGMYGPVAYDDTWASNVSRVASILSKPDDTVTWDDKVQNNMPFFFSPEGDSDLVGSYQEIVDVGTLVPSSAITVTVTSNTLSGEPTMTQLIETSEDLVVWSIVDTTGKALSKNFRYVRITLSWTGGLVYVSDIHFQMASSEMNDAGNVIFTDEDYLVDDKPIDSTDDEPIGKLVKFNKQFVDIIAFTGLTVRGTGQKSAYVIFKDTPNPTWFRVFILDKDGNRAPGQVDWSVKGV